MSASCFLTYKVRIEFWRLTELVQIKDLQQCLLHKSSINICCHYFLSIAVKGNEERPNNNKGPEKGALPCLHLHCVDPMPFRTAFWLWPYLLLSPISFFTFPQIISPKYLFLKHFYWAPVYTLSTLVDAVTSCPDLLSGVKDLLP